MADKQRKTWEKQKYKKSKKGNKITFTSEVISYF